MKSRSSCLALCFVLAALTLFVALPVRAGALVIATVDSAHMRRLQTLSSEFEKANPEIRIRWVVLEESELRRVASADVETRDGLFDVITIGIFKVPIWAASGWIKPLRSPDDFDVDDLLPTVRKALSYQQELYAAPIYGESSMLMYRKDLLKKAGLTMPDRPTWTEVAAFAAKLHDPANGVHGICLRGRPGWIENMALVSTMVNSFGGQWFDAGWRPQLDSLPWKKAVGLYAELLNRYGPPDAASLGYGENLSLFASGRCAQWVGPTVAAEVLTNPESSAVAGEVGFAAAPYEVTAKGAQWLWAWALAIPSSIDPVREADARKFIHWVASRDYVELVAARQGWRAVPTGTRRSTYARPEFQRKAPWAVHELEAMLNADPENATLPPSPYPGIQFAAIPEFILIGDEVGNLIAEALAGRLSVEEALVRGQDAAQRRMVRGGYPR